ncbi:reverse transcriptase [Phytophthora megakarya]|uniref:Reverse transcriptase n=1 Tax=Phytophthora megakarya TaxID=4795 RepID=A0A225V980_9STRA|nr:reverse transcriptase [Phytophthora megakarya]
MPQVGGQHGAAKRDGSGGAACILWSLPSWEIEAATGHFLEKATVNEAEYSGLVKGMQLALNIGIQELEAERLQAKFKSLRLVHVKRDFNAAADYISKRGIQEQSSLEVTALGEGKLLEGLNRIYEKLMKDPSPREQPLVSEKSNAAEESTAESGADHLEPVNIGGDELGTEGAEDGLAAGPRNPNPLDPEEDPEDARRERWRKTTAKIADPFVLDSRGALFYVNRNTPERPRDAADRLRLILRKEFYWIEMFKDTERYVKEFVDDDTAKGLPQNPGSSPGNLLATRPFQVVSMDFVYRCHSQPGETQHLLLFQCAFSGFIMCKAMASTEAQDVAEAYEECVFRWLGASEMIRHDGDPRFMGRVFKHFWEMLGSRQRATLAYRPQANGQPERSVQTVIRSIKAYVQTVDQSNWDELAEKLMWALNNSFDFTRLDTPFYLIHGWDAQGIVEAMKADFPWDVQLRDAQEWRTKIQRQVGYARVWARDLQAKAKRRRAEDHNRK